VMSAIPGRALSAGHAIAHQVWTEEEENYVQNPDRR
jgi:hypothetical protein